MADTAPPVPTVTIDDLRVFHAKHFPHAAPPEQFVHGAEAANPCISDAAEEYYEEDDGLGYYPDGAKRTLTDEQIAMFRHSEIQEMLRKQRSRREDEELTEDKPASTDRSPHPETPVASHASTPTSQILTVSTGDLKQTQSGRVEKPKVQQWATSSARTKKRNKQNRDNYRAKKKAEGQKRKKASYGKGDEDESDEWDPWHQANGPDVQKEEALDLDY